MNSIANVKDPALALKRAYVALMRARETYLYSGALLLGKSTLAESIPTAATNGVDKMYNPDFLTTLTPEEVAGVVLHEGLHIFMKHFLCFRGMVREDARTSNAAMDYSINLMIKDIEKATQGKLLKLPACALYDEKFTDWSVREIYNFLRTGRNPDGGNEGEPQPAGDGVKIGGKTYQIDTHDAHDTATADGMTEEEIEAVTSQIDQAIQEAAIFAGRDGAKLPRALTEVMHKDIDWRDALAEFITAHSRGNDDVTFTRYNRKRVMDEVYMPSVRGERMGRVIMANDTSGSISQQMLAIAGGALATLCGQVQPEEVLVLWWDTQVHGAQRFDETSYDNLASLLKPAGGGGTRVGCVSDYIKREHIDADCLVVFTDGYVEAEPKWEIGIPVLWLVVGNDRFMPPAGVKVKFTQ